MLKLRSKGGQTILVEYVIVILLFVSVIIAMTVYFQRAMKSTLRTSAIFAQNRVYTFNYLDAYGQPVNIFKQYEEYYTNRTVDLYTDTTETRRLLGTGPNISSGIFRKDINSTRIIGSFSNQVPSKDAR